MKIQVTKKILTGILTISTASVILAILLITGYMHRYYSDLAEAELENSGDLIASAVEYIGDEYLYNTDLSEFRVTWIDSSGNVLFDSEEDTSKLENHADRSEVIEAMDVANRIQKKMRDDNDRPVYDVRIIRATVIKP